MKLTVHDDPEVLTERTRALKKLKTIKVKVGLPPSAGDRLHFILAVQEHGSPIMHIPSRPVIHPALTKDENPAAQQSGHRKRRVDLEPGGEESRVHKGQGIQQAPV